MGLWLNALMPYASGLLQIHDSIHEEGGMIVDSKLANPAPLGLMGFGMTTVLLNIHNAGFFPIGSMIPGDGLVLRRFSPDHRGNS